MRPPDGSSTPQTGGSDSLAIYAVDSETGELSPVGHESSQGVGPRDFTIDPSGALLLVANQDTAPWSRSGSIRIPGRCGQAGTWLHVPTPVCLQLVNA